MQLDELFGLLKKKEEPARGSDEERLSLAKQMIDVFLRYDPQNVKHSYISQTIRDLIKRDTLDVIDVERNDLMRSSIIKTIASSKLSLDQMEQVVNKMEQVVKEK